MEEVEKLELEILKIISLSILQKKKKACSGEKK